MQCLSYLLPSRFFLMRSSKDISRSCCSPRGVIHIDSVCCACFLRACLYIFMMFLSVGIPSSCMFARVITSVSACVEYKLLLVMNNRPFLYCMGSYVYGSSHVPVRSITPIASPSLSIAEAINLFSSATMRSIFTSFCAAAS